VRVRLAPRAASPVAPLLRAATARGGARGGVSPKRKKRGPRLHDGACVRLRAARPNHVWSDDFLQDRTQDGRACRIRPVTDAFTWQALVILPARKRNKPTYATRGQAA